jgi:hypothetical protein
VKAAPLLILTAPVGAALSTVHAHSAGALRSLCGRGVRVAAAVHRPHREGVLPLGEVRVGAADAASTFILTPAYQPGVPPVRTSIRSVISRTSAAQASNASDALR